MALAHVLVGLAGVVAAEVGAVVELARAELVVVDLDGVEKGRLEMGALGVITFPKMVTVQRRPSP